MALRFPPRYTVPVALLLLLARAATAQSFSTAPLAQPVVWPETYLPRDPNALLQNLVERRGRMDHDDRLAAIRQIYAVLAERVKHQGNNGMLPPDATLALLMAEADRFGVVSAARVADALGSHVHRPNAQYDRDEFELDLNGGSFTLAASRGGWRIALPYYFALRSAQRSEQGEEPAFDNVSVWTMAAANGGPSGGVSEAEILITSSETTDSAAFLARWRATFSAYTAYLQRVPREGAVRTYIGADRARHTRSETNLYKTANGWLLVGFYGNEGPFAANHEHYLDVLRSLHIR